MGYACTVIADSVTQAGARLTSFLVTFPRFILAEVNTHRMLSRNSASSRAIPIAKRIAAVETDPFIPASFGANKPGMQSDRDVLDQDGAREAWKLAARSAVFHAKQLAGHDVHKQLANRILEPFLWHTAILTATEWANFYAQRCHADAQPEFRTIATTMREAHQASTPRVLSPGEWHLPMIDDADFEQWMSVPRDTYTQAAAVLGGFEIDSNLDQQYALAMVSAGRCARTSYLTHDGKRDMAADAVLAMRLVKSGHMSPLEHPARCMSPSWKGDAGNFAGQWKQLRKHVDGEAVFRGE